MYTYWTDTAATKFTAQVKHQTASYEESNKLVNFCWCDSQNIAQYLTSAAVAPEELFLLERNILIVKEVKVIKTPQCRHSEKFGNWPWFWFLPSFFAQQSKATKTRVRSTSLERGVHSSHSSVHWRLLTDSPFGQRVSWLRKIKNKNTKKKGC